MRKGKGGIRTLNSFRNYADFQDRSHKPYPAKYKVPVIDG